MRSDCSQSYSSGVTIPRTTARCTILSGNASFRMASGTPRRFASVSHITVVWHRERNPNALEPRAVAERPGALNRSLSRTITLVAAALPLSDGPGWSFPLPDDRMSRCVGSLNWFERRCTSGSMRSSLTGSIRTTRHRYPASMIPNAGNARYRSRTMTGTESQLPLRKAPPTEMSTGLCCMHHR